MKHSWGQASILALFLFSFVNCAGSTKFANSHFHHEPEIRVRVTSGYRPEIKSIPLETYLAGVIGHEMSPRWPDEALRAQTIAARSYALYGILRARSKNQSFDVVDTQADQVFRESGTSNQHLQKIVRSTRGEVIWENNKIVQAFYSSTCGGQSETASNAGLASDSPLCIPFTDNFCKISPFHFWSATLSNRDVLGRLNRAGYTLLSLKKIDVSEKTSTGYAKTVTVSDAVHSYEIPAKEFRNRLGNMRIKSLNFKIRPSSDSLYFVGNGFGHGVGLCQYGAKGMAESGKSYQEILKKYYPKTEIRKIYR